MPEQSGSDPFRTMMMHTAARDGTIWVRAAAEWMDSEQDESGEDLVSAVELEVARYYGLSQDDMPTVRQLRWEYLAEQQQNAKGSR